MALGTMMSLAALAGPQVVAMETPAEIVVPLEYASYSDPNREERTPVTYGRANLESSFEPPAGDWKLPQLASDLALYGRITLGDVEFLCVLDKVGDGMCIYDRLYVDRNANRDLTDDEVVLREESESISSVCSFDHVDLVIPVGGLSLPYCLSFRASSRSVSFFGEGRVSFDRESMRFYAKSHCGYTGEFELDGETYRVALGDGRLNGRFDDLAYPAEEDDRDSDAALPLNGDGFWIGGVDGGDYRDAHRLGNRLAIGGRLFTMEVDVPEKRLVLSPFTEPTGQLRLPAKLERVHLSVAGGRDQLIAYRPGETLTVPAGECRLLWYQIYTEDAQGDEWYLAAEATQKTSAVQATAGTVIDLALGEPFEPRGKIPDYIFEELGENLGDFAGALPARLHMFITGRGNERLVELLHLSGSATEIELDEERERPKEASYAVVDQGGKLVTKGRFRYG